MIKINKGHTYIIFDDSDNINANLTFDKSDGELTFRNRSDEDTILDEDESRELYEFMKGYFENRPAKIT